MLNAVYPKANLTTTTDTDRGRSRNVWSKCPVSELMEDPSKGHYFFDDFLASPKTFPTTEGNFAQYTGFSDNSNTWTAGTGQGGEAVFTLTSNDNGSINLRTLQAPFKIGRSTKRFWFECRLKTSTIADTKHDIFVGLVQDTAFSATVPVTAAGALADVNLVGFFRPETARTVAGTGGAIMNTVYKADGVTAVTVQSDAATLVASTYTKLGMVYEPLEDLLAVGSTKYLLRFYQDGVQLSSTYQINATDGIDFPNDIGLGPAFALVAATGTTPGNTTLDWWAAAQLYY